MKQQCFNEESFTGPADSVQHEFAGACFQDLFKDYSLRRSEFVDAFVQSTAR